MPNCIEWGQRREQKCTQTRDDGYQDCKQYRDDGYNSCDRWDKNCCDWWPCSWACKIITWVCVAWIWVSNVVCVFAVWVANVVCVAWDWVTTAICVAWDVVTLIAGAILETIESILGWVASAIAFVIELLLTVPVIGRLIGWALAIVQTVHWAIAGLVDTAAGLVGIRPEKKLRLCTIVLAEERGMPLVPASTVVPWLQKAIDVYKQEANVRIIPVAPFHYTTGFGDNETATEDWVHVRTKASSTRILDLGDEAATLGADLIDIGSHYNAIANVECIYGTWRKVAGYGAPVTVFVIRKMQNGVGRSLGPLTDYVVLSATQANIVTLPHEMGHACNLPHDPDVNNLMYAGASTGTSLNWWQVAVIRSSRHVTYF